VELNLGRTTSLGLDLAQAIACTNEVYADSEVILKGRRGSSKSGRSKSGKSKS
tara:strand:+ start:306 stop:464 length:159 start_codon:yes stop_codon:yes gene_type:complete